ncbi:hypothetical protein HPB49_003440 [Dermacentor silvarum]|uniref:Uncharacterized protein n=1 Tax=Dermacentor silvarum TaxID=543639 RepID=A0ACB8DTN5_DERSI|nr:hypothetical protein HPB49_003440 [Dermacentor silvarum]
MLKEWIANAMDRTPPTLMRRLLEADVTTECSLGLLKMMRGVRNLEPWALRPWREATVMVSATSVHSSPAASLFVVAVFLCACATTPCFGGDEANTSSPEARQSEATYVQMLKEWIGNAMDRAPPTLMRKLLEADVSTECSLGLLKMMRGVRNLEPWALRPEAKFAKVFRRQCDQMLKVTQTVMIYQRL